MTRVNLSERDHHTALLGKFLPRVLVSCTEVMAFGHHSSPSIVGSSMQCQGIFVGLEESQETLSKIKKYVFLRGIDHPKLKLGNEDAKSLRDCCLIILVAGEISWVSAEYSVQLNVRYIFEAGCQVLTLISVIMNALREIYPYTSQHYGPVKRYQNLVRLWAALVTVEGGRC